MGNLATLQTKPWKKGQSGNPKGKKPGTKNRSTILKYWLSAPTKQGNEYDDVMLALICKAKQGDVAAIKEIQDTIHGKLTDKADVNLGGELKHSIVVEIINGSKSDSNENQD